MRAYRQEPHEIERFRAANEEYVRRNRGLIRLQGLFFPSMTLFLGFGSLLVLWLGSREVIRGRITLGEFVAFNAYLVMLSWPMIAFGWVTNMLQRGMASWKRMLEVLDAVPDDQTTPTVTAARPARCVDPGRDRVPRPDVHVSGREPPVLDDVSLRIAAGQTVAIVGATGSGKSTLISLLPRLHEPPPGTVLRRRRRRARDSAGARCAARSASCRRSRSCSPTRIAENIAFGVRRRRARSDAADA